MSEIRMAYVWATNDSNGNPQRGWVVWQDGKCQWVEEGFDGNSAVLKHLGYDLSIPGEYDKGMDVLYDTRGIRVHSSVVDFYKLRTGDFSVMGISDVLNNGTHLQKSRCVA